MKPWQRVFLAAILSAGFGSGCVGTPLGSRGSSIYGDDDGGYRDDRWRAEEEAWRRDREKQWRICEDVDERIHFDRRKLAEIEPGRHEKAAQWYRDDIANAERDRARCRGEGRRYDRDRDRAHEDRQRELDRQRALIDARRRCAEIRDRIRNDRQKLAEIQPGRHQKAAQWYRDDIQNAERDLQRCSR